MGTLGKVNKRNENKNWIVIYGPREKLKILINFSNPGKHKSVCYKSKDNVSGSQRVVEHVNYLSTLPKFHWSYRINIKIEIRP